MRAYLATNIIGCFAFDKDGRLLDEKFFKKDPETIAAKLALVREKKIIQEEKEVIESLIRKGYKEVVCDKAETPKLKMSFLPVKENPGERFLQEQFRRLAMESKWVSSQAELNEILSKVNVLLTKERLREEKRDQLIIHSIGFLDELDRTLNIFSERIREWYGLYFPEAARIVGSNEKLLETAAMGDRKNITEKSLGRLLDRSAGMPFRSTDIQSFQVLSKTLLEMFKRKKELTTYIETLTKEEIPNISALAGGLLSARLIAHAGGLEKFSKLPSSTIQILGAEKSLFRHLKNRENLPPKYGLLFGHPFVQQAPQELKGKVARLIAAKLSLGAKMDFFSKRDNSAELKEQLERQVKLVLKG